MPDIWFPYLGIEIEHLSKYAITIGSFYVAWYGVIIACGVVAGLLTARALAKRSGQDPEMYTDFLIYALIFSVIGARTYYVAFEWDNYKDDLLSILNIRNGGLAIYGAVIASVLTAVFYCRSKHKPVLELLDTAMPGLVLGQAIGRWGNFFNQEAFGSYTDSVFAMRLNIKTAAYTTTELLQNSVKVGDVRYIQVHPTFLYESIGCLAIFAIMLIVFKHRKFRGQTACVYMIGYGILRAFIENLRTDQLKVWNTDFPVSVFVSVVMALLGVILMIILGARAKVEAKKKANKGKKNEYAPSLDADDDDAAHEEFSGASETSEQDDESSDAAEASDNVDDIESVGSDAAADSDAEDEAASEADKAAEEEETEASADLTDEKNKPTEEDLWG
ncbi:MAG: prolipoprotein diacylglyceryl transferase [Lachnospiraceae bacterium]|nr:prolipoprotein diacylglyceryl transferase [Lachnospiraceae bacterium]